MADGLTPSVTNGTGDTRNKLDWMTTDSLKSLNFLELDADEKLSKLGKFSIDTIVIKCNW